MAPEPLLSHPGVPTLPHAPDVLRNKFAHVLPCQPSAHQENAGLLESLTTGT